LESIENNSSDSTVASEEMPDGWEEYQDAIESEKGIKESDKHGEY
jgi:hypothetical protein